MNKRTQGHIYRAQTLRLLAHLGYASTRQVTKAVWRECDESSRKMAGRTLRWLLEHSAAALLPVVLAMVLAWVLATS